MSFDELSQQFMAFLETHPLRLGALARLHGVDPEDPRRARILELGCRGGGNLIPVALRHPETRCVGIEAPGRWVEGARAVAGALQLENVRFLDEPPEEEFDYIVAHGIYSWVSSDAQELLLERIRSHLAPNGVAYVSFDALPGWTPAQVVRDVMRLQVDAGDDPGEQLTRARAVAHHLAEQVDWNEPRGALIRREVERLDRLSDVVLRFELLGEHHEALHLCDFLDRASGLQLVCDALFEEPNVPDGADEGLEGVDRLQLLDLLGNRRFWRAVLVRDHHELALRPERLQGLTLATLMRPVSSRKTGKPTFQSLVGKGELVAEHPVLALVLRRLWAEPPGLAYETLLEDVCGALNRPLDEETRSVLEGLVLRLLRAGAVEALWAPRPYTTRPGRLPVADPLLRLQASGKAPLLTSCRHQSLSVGPLGRLLLVHCDGTKDIGQIYDAILADLGSGAVKLTWPAGEEDLQSQLPKLLSRQMQRLAMEGAFR